MLADSSPSLPLYRSQSLWNVVDRHETRIGCIACPDRKTCGGLQMEAQVFSCLDFCCGNPDSCDKVCRLNASEFAGSLREVSDWTLDNVRRHPPLEAPLLPSLVPLIAHGSTRSRPFDGTKVICLPFFKVIDKSDDSPRFTSREFMAAHFGVDSGASIILTGTDRDRPLEQWWSFTLPRRRDAIRRLRDLGIRFVTTPNYSLFTDVPRWENLFSMKRIALVHEEFLAEGMAAGLHVNARTERDWERWIDYVQARPEVTHLAYEFGTGASRGPRLEWHARHLGLLAREVARPLHLVVRGGMPALPQFASAFNKVTYIDTNAFTKTVRARQRAYFVRGRLRWRSFLTAKREPLDDLLSHNWEAVAKDFTARFGDYTSHTSRSGRHGAADILGCR